MEAGEALCPDSLTTRKRTWKEGLVTKSSTESVPLLIVEAVELEVSHDILAAMKGELKAGGLVTGMFYVGGIVAVPDTIYMLWHMAGEAPVTCLIPRASVDTVEGARETIQEFLLKWNQRLG